LAIVSFYAQVDKASTLSPLGLEKGDALLAIDGNDVGSYGDLKSVPPPA